MRKPVKTFEDLLVWQKAHLFVLAVYCLSMAFPKYEIYGYILNSEYLNSNGNYCIQLKKEI